MGQLKSSFFLVLAWVAITAQAQDWPQHLGPSRDLHFPGTIKTDWPKEGPPILWQEKIGSGWSGPVVSGKKLILFHRVGNNEIVEARETGTGKKLWAHSYPSEYVDDFGFDPGPRSTPCIDGDHLYTMGANGLIHCLNLETGEKKWSLDSRKTFSAPKGYFGMVCSPLVVGEIVLFNIGGADGAGIIALDKKSGKLVWKTSEEEASYSSPVLARIEEKNTALFFTPNGLLGISPETGQELFRYSLKPNIRASVSAASPLVQGNQIFISASYGAGAAVVEIQGGKPKKIWGEDDILSNHYATSVLEKGHLYGFDGRQEQKCDLRCVDWKTGKVAWTQARYGAGTLLSTGSHLLIMRESGELVLAKASPEKFTTVHATQILPFGTRAYPALAHGLFYARSEDKLVCVDLRPSP